MDINSRQIQLIKLLLGTSNTTAKKLADCLSVSTKTIYKDLKHLEPYLKQNNIAISVQPRKGIKVNANGLDTEKFFTGLNSKNSSIPNNNHEREQYILVKLITEKGFISVDQIAAELYISPKTIIRNLDSIDMKLKESGLKVDRVPSKGLRIKGSEVAKRRELFKLINNSLNNSYSFLDNWEFNNRLLNNKFIDYSLVVQINSTLKEFEQQYGLKLNYYNFQSLLVHLVIAVERIKSGHYIQDKHDSFLKKIGNKNLDQAKALANLVEKGVGVKVPHDEIKFIQMHLIAASTTGIKLSSNRSDYPQFKELKSLVKDFGYDSALLEGLHVHLSSAIKRLKVHVGIYNPYTAEIKKNYPRAFEQALVICNFYEKKYKIKFNQDEVAYIALHFEAFIERQRQLKGKTKVIIVCTTGLGSAQLLAAILRKKFPDIKIEAVLSAEEVEEADLRDIDLIISTINIEIKDVNIVVVPPIIDDSDIRRIKKKISNIRDNNEKKNRDFLSLINPQIILTHSNAETPKQVIEQLGNLLILHGFANEGIVASSLKREKVSFTSYKNYAIPHAAPSLVKKSAIAICTLDKPIVWGQSLTSIVFFLAMSKRIKQESIENVFDAFYNLVSNESELKKLVQLNNSADIVAEIERYVKNGN
ncbi:BglG family transcription antiterminator [Lactobacillus corticis]|uniref:Transcriptional regulator n=1 Tax=Lactobacillus corticis TaxID=2201249 RepID=A0A916QF52_9LACO|nr:BglG family transcription antiterminator [Lactobacillus corticis]GFZ26150.1 transcriptional regulator [Lactobacillus corticis]